MLSLQMRHGFAVSQVAPPMAGVSQVSVGTKTCKLLPGTLMKKENGPGHSSTLAEKRRTSDNEGIDF